MSDLLNSLNEKADTKPWADEVAEAASAPAEAPAAVPETVSADPALEAPVETEAATEAPQQQEEHDRRVPLKALQEERHKRAEYERQLQEFQRREQEWAAWAEQMQQQMQPQEQFPEPDPETDPIGALKYTKQQLEAMQQYAAQQAYVQQQAQHIDTLNKVAFQSATQYQQKTPDYQDAYRYALNSRAQELMALGTPQEAIPAVLQREELSLIDTALRNGRNPAEAIYHFAKARGFSGNTAPASNDPNLQQAKAAVAPSATSGGAPSTRGSMSLADIANLKGAAFDSAWNKHFGGNKNSLFRE